jgi:uncharacterized protein HemY
MKWPTKIFFVLVIATVVSLVALVSRQSLRTPREVLEDVQAALESEGYDERALLRSLGGGLHKAKAQDPTIPAVRDICAELHLARGRLLLAIGATQEARADFEIVLEQYRPGDRDVRRLLIETESAAGEVEQALAHLQELLAAEPAFGPAWVEAGRLEKLLAEQALERCDEKLRLVLIDEETQRASVILRTLVARDPSDPRRATNIVLLRELFPVSADESLGQILGLAELASAHLARCREALVHSFSISLDPVALTRYLEILEDSGRADEALALGSLVAALGPAKADPDSAALLIRLLLERGDNEHASQLAMTWTSAGQPLSAHFLRLACQALYLGQKWPALSQAAYSLRSIGSLDDENIYSLYYGLFQALSNNRRPDLALLSLTTFARSTTEEPFVGARGRAWREIAKLQQEAGNVSGEREALQAALLLVGTEAGPLWVRLSEIQLTEKNNGYRLPLESWTKAMNLMPQRSEEMLEKFIELGEKTLASEERSFDVLFEDLMRSGLSSPKRNYGPYVQYRIAQRHGRARSQVSRVAAAKALLDAYPGFLPALDELIAARHALGDREVYIELVLRHLELGGLTPAAESLLATIDVSEFSSEQLVRAMRLDPRTTGRMAVAAWFASNGDNAAALATLESSNASSRSDAENLFGARVLITDGNYRAALRWLDQIADDSPRRGEGLRLAADAALRLGDTAVVAERGAALLGGAELDPVEMLSLVDSFLQRGNAGAAKLLLERIPRGPLRDPGAALRREIQVALLMENGPQADLLIERAGAFLPESSYLAVRILLSAGRGEWTSLRGEVEELRQTPFAKTPSVATLLDLLSGQEATAAESATFALSLAPDLPKWILIDALARQAAGHPLDLSETLGRSGNAQTELFLAGAGAREVDPRELAALLLLAEDKSFTPYVLGTLKQLEAGEAGTLWPALVSADLLLESGRRAEAADLYRELLTRHRDCLPAWDALEAIELAKYRTSLHPQLALLRDQRLSALAKGQPEGAAGLLQAARRLSTEGDLGAALRVLLNAQKITPQWYEVRHAIAQTYSQMGHWEAALESWRALAGDADRANAPRAVLGLLEALRLAEQADPPAIDLATIKADLERLSAAFPSDPHVVLALARLDLRRDLRNPALALERAWTRLHKLRADYEPKSLEELGRGATRVWAEFYVETDPDSAEEFLLSELARQPGNLHLWQLYGRLQRELGRYAASYEILARVSLMAPSAEVQVEIARTFLAQGAAPRSVARALQQADQLRGSGKQALDSRLLAAESFLNDFRSGSWQAAVEQLELLWEERLQLEHDELRTQLAALYSRALLLRDGEGDAALAVEILEEAYPRTAPPYQREHFTCLLGIARSRSGLSE